MHLPIVLRASLVAGGLALVALMALPARADDNSPRQRPATISLTGTGEIAVAPDEAIISSGVITEATTAREALDANNGAIARVIAAIKEAGIEARDIQTAGVSVTPRYRYPRNDGREDSETPRIIGYTVSNTVSVRVRDLARLGQVMDQVVTVGANRIDGISFVVSDADARLDEARGAAVRDARRKAEIYAEAAGVKLGRLVSISEGGGFVPPQPKAEMMMARADAMSVPVEIGEERLRVQVNITWELEQ